MVWCGSPPPPPQRKKTGKIRAEIICLRVDLLAPGVIHACKWRLKTPTNVFIHRFQGIVNANVFSERAVHNESKMIIFTSGPLQGFTFSGKFCTQSATRRPPKLRFWWTFFD